MTSLCSKCGAQPSIKCKCGYDELCKSCNSRFHFDTADCNDQLINIIETDTMTERILYQKQRDRVNNKRFNTMENLYQTVSEQLKQQEEDTNKLIKEMRLAHEQEIDTLNAHLAEQTKEIMQMLTDLETSKQQVVSRETQIDMLMDKIEAHQIQKKRPLTKPKTKTTTRANNLHH